MYRQLKMPVIYGRKISFTEVRELLKQSHVLAVEYVETPSDVTEVPIDDTPSNILNELLISRIKVNGKLQLENDLMLFFDEEYYIGYLVCDTSRVTKESVIETLTHRMMGNDAYVYTIE